MSEEKITISIVRNRGESSQEITDIHTNGYILLYLEGENIKTSGNIELKALTPIFMKIAIEKLTGRMS